MLLFFGEDAQVGFDDGLGCRLRQRHGDRPGTEQLPVAADVAVSSLYVVTHSVVVTLIGTTAATVTAGWATWLSSRRQEPDTHPAAARLARK